MRWKLVRPLLLPECSAAVSPILPGSRFRHRRKSRFFISLKRPTAVGRRRSNEARPKMEAALGQKIPFVENVPEVAGKIKPAAETFISRGSNIVIGTAFGYSDTFKELSEKYPKVAFLNAPAPPTALTAILLRPDLQSQYLCGMVAGAMSKTGKLGFVAAHPIGPVNWTINAYELRRSKNEAKCDDDGRLYGLLERSGQRTCRGISFGRPGHRRYRPTRRHADPASRCSGARHFGTGHHRDLREFAPKATLCSSVWTWEKFLIPGAKKIEAGNWQPSPYGAFPASKRAVPTSLVVTLRCQRTSSKRSWRSVRPLSTASKFSPAR